jgi:hypothetical protein
MSTKPIQINDVIVFNPESFEGSRVNDTDKRWLYCSGVNPWRGVQIPFVMLAGFANTPLGNDVEVLMSGIGGWLAHDLEWCNIPCDPSNCMLVVERDGQYVKLQQLNDDYKSPMSLERMWVSAAVLENGITNGIIRVLP